jgi:hypothetical protein
MAYTIRNTRNQLVATVVDGAVDSTTNVRLIGKNFVGYGTALNENIIALLENFASPSAPNKPVTGMLWYDTSTNDLYVYNGANTFVPAIKTASNLTVTGNVSASNLTVTGNVSASNVSATTSMSAPTFNGNISGTTANLTGNANVGNLGTAQVLATANVTAPQLISNISVGTAPLVVTSTTQVANLNVAVAGSLVNGNSNVTVTANANVTVGVAGNAAILTVTGTGANIAGGASITGNANVGNLGTATAIITTGNITTINSGLMQNGNSNVTIAANANVSVFVTGNATARAVFTSTGANIAGTANITGNANVGNLGTATAIITTGNITTINSGLMQNGNSNVTIAANANVIVNVTAANSYTFATGSFAPSSNAAVQLGLTGARWSNIWGLASSAQYADLAERYHSDEEYLHGTVMSLGGEFEVTQSTTDADDKVFGVVSKDPAYLMNDADQDSNWLPIVLIGRSPVRVTGPVTKGQWLVSAGDGTARAAGAAEVRFDLVVGRSLVNKTHDTPELIEAYICTK